MGESPVWRAADQAFHWTDIPGRALWRWTPANDRLDHWTLPQMAGCIAPRGDGWLLAMEDGLYACGPVSYTHLVFAGDSAPRVSPFGARGANSGVQM